MSCGARSGSRNHHLHGEEQKRIVILSIFWVFVWWNETKPYQCMWWQPRVYMNIEKKCNKCVCDRRSLRFKCSFLNKSVTKLGRGRKFRKNKLSCVCVRAERTKKDRDFIKLNKRFVEKNEEGKFWGKKKIRFKIVRPVWCDVRVCLWSLELVLTKTIRLLSVYFWAESAQRDTNLEFGKFGGPISRRHLRSLNK